MKSFITSGRQSYWLIVLLSLSFIHATAQEPVVVTQPDSSAALVNLSDLLVQVEKDAREIKKLRALAQDTSQVEKYRNSIYELEISVTKVKEQSDFFLQAFARAWLIQNLNAKWMRLNDEWEEQGTLISNSTETVETRLRTVREMTSKWEKNKKAVSKDSVRVSLNKPISDLMDNLNQVEILFQAKIKSYLYFQERIAVNRAEINQYLEILVPLRKQDFVTFFERDHEPFWNRTEVYRAPRIDRQMLRSIQFSSQDIIEYMRASVGKVVLVLVMAVFFVVLFLRNSRRIREESENDTPLQEDSLRTIKFPLTYSYTFTLLIALLTLTSRPPLLTEFLLLFFTLPLITLVVKRSTGMVKTIAQCFLILYWFDFLADFFVLNPLIGLYVDLFNAIVTSILLYVAYRNRLLVRAQFPRLNDFFLRALPVLLILNILSVILLLIGFTNLARALTTGTITFIYLAPVIIICSVTLQDLFHLLKDTAFFRASRIASNYYYLIDRAIRLGAFYLLCRTFLAAFTLTSLFEQVWEEFWNFGGQFGEFHITVGDVLEFFIIILVSWTISAVLKVLLTDEILSRTRLKRGVPMAIGVIVRYTVILLGFILAIASTGFDLNKISILAGGLGVGIGFGLQHLVANFIAGLILIFERPIVVGDTVESEQIEGEVKQIGIRSSKILTYDGAEVIIPNSNLINNKLSNWTLSNYSRRQLIVVRTSMKADPEKVLGILNRIVKQHENVLITPEPFVLFEGQLEQSLQFKIYYWLISELFRTRGELHLQIYRELKEMGVELPIPVQEIKRSWEEETDIINPRLPLK